MNDENNYHIRSIMQYKSVFFFASHTPLTKAHTIEEPRIYEGKCMHFESYIY